MPQHSVPPAHLAIPAEPVDEAPQPPSGRPTGAKAAEGDRDGAAEDACPVAGQAKETGQEAEGNAGAGVDAEQAVLASGNRAVCPPVGQKRPAEQSPSADCATVDRHGTAQDPAVQVGFLPFKRLRVSRATPVVAIHGLTSSQESIVEEGGSEVVVIAESQAFDSLGKASAEEEKVHNDMDLDVASEDSSVSEDDDSEGTTTSPGKTGMLRALTQPYTTMHPIGDGPAFDTLKAVLSGPCLENRKMPRAESPRVAQSRLAEPVQAEHWAVRLSGDALRSEAEVASICGEARGVPSADGAAEASESDPQTAREAAQTGAAAAGEAHRAAAALDAAALEAARELEQDRQIAAALAEGFIRRSGTLPEEGAAVQGPTGGAEAPAASAWTHVLECAACHSLCGLTLRAVGAVCECPVCGLRFLPRQHCPPPPPACLPASRAEPLHRKGALGAAASKAGPGADKGGAGGGLRMAPGAVLGSAAHFRSGGGGGAAAEEAGCALLT